MNYSIITFSQYNYFPYLGACSEFRLIRLSPVPSDYTNTVYPRSSDPFYIVSYCIKWVATSWTYSNSFSPSCPLSVFFSFIPSVVFLTGICKENLVKGGGAQGAHFAFPGFTVCHLVILYGPFSYTSTVHWQKCGQRMLFTCFHTIPDKHYQEQGYLF